MSPQGINTGGGSAIDGAVHSADFTGRDDRQQSMNISFAPNDLSLWQPGVIYTLQEVLAQVNQKLDEHGKQLQSIWQELVSIKFEQSALKREIDEMKEHSAASQTAAERERQQQYIAVYRVVTVFILVIIVVMLAWLITHLGAR